jgi:hypothetical protein
VGVTRLEDGVREGVLRHYSGQGAGWGSLRGGQRCLSVCQWGLGSGGASWHWWWLAKRICGVVWISKGVAGRGLYRGVLRRAVGDS